MLHRRTVIFGILLLAVSAAGPALAGPYYVTDLGILASGTGYNSYAMGVNDYGVVVGGSTTSKANSAKIVATIYTPGPARPGRISAAASPAAPAAPSPPASATPDWSPAG